MKNRLKILRLAVCIAFLAGLGFSYELWFPVTRTFPRAPFVFELPVRLEQILAVILVVSLILIAVSFRPKIFFATTFAALAVLIFFDQTRLQPWVYQYFLILVVLALQEENEENSGQTLALVQILLAALYFWSGAQKLNYSFAHETLPLLLATVRNIFPSIEPPFVFLGLTIALVEILTGLGLLFRRTRHPAVCLAAATHLIILALLIAKNYNQIVWLWNAALIALVAAAFWKSDVSIKQIFRKTADLKIAKTIVAASVLLPALSFFGLWDMYLSGALYSGSAEIGVVRLNEDLFGKLPPSAQTLVFRTGAGERMLPLLEWAVAEMNVPVYPEERVFRKVARQLCRSADDKNQIELIVRPRPAILDGSYKIVRLNCANV